MLRGNFRTDIQRRNLSCDPGFAWTEPLGERHANHAGSEGAHVVVIQPDAGKHELLSPLTRLLGDVSLLRHPRVIDHARRITAELRTPDTLNGLCVEALAVMLLADAARVKSRDGNGNRVPAWLKLARDLLHDRWRDGLNLSQVAASVCMHPVHFTRMFRRYYGQSVGAYVRRLRLDWAVRELESSERPISAVALEAGYSDQSHFTRECKRHYGFTPAAYRLECSGAALRRGAPNSGSTGGQSF
jgi:AraC family transcriptional regulator